MDTSASKPSLRRRSSWPSKNRKARSRPGRRVRRSRRSRRIVLGVSGSIAAYKACLIVRDLVEAGARSETIAAAEAEVAAAEAGLEQARVALAETELKAPLAGTVASLEVKEGEQVVPGSPVVVLADLSAWQIETDDLTELNIVRIREGDPVKISVDAIPDKHGLGDRYSARSPQWPGSKPTPIPRS